MASMPRSTAPTPALEPTVNQWITPKRRTRSWKKGLVYDPSKNTVEIKSRAELENDPSYMACALPKNAKCVSIFLDSTETKAFAVGTVRKGEGQIFIGMLNLEKLGIIARLSRSWRLLETLYIVKQVIPDTDGLEAVRQLSGSK